MEKTHAAGEAAEKCDLARDGATLGFSDVNGTPGMVLALQ